MEKVLSKEEVQVQLQGKTEAIARRIDALGQELSTTGTALTRALFKHPLVSVGGAVAGGLLVGLLFKGRKRRGRRQALQRTHRALLDRYIDTVAEEARHAIGRGQASDEAIRGALRERAPLIVYAPPPEESKRGLFKEAMDLTFKTAMAFVVKAAIDFLTARVNLAQFTELREASQEPAPARDPAPVTAAVADET